MAEINKMSVAIKVENLSKAYQLGEIGTGTISRDIERWIARIRGKEDPFLIIGETNDRTVKGSSDVVWSLKDVNFEIQQGDAVGIIGRNGAGKSTLLKILSRVTSPTSGTIKAKGRIASLLEVGTGFHPDLTGRENIYLNGAILGMRKREIVRQFDKIVDFAGVERYIDTPVKRYSSGMYVRLAFAVAAHLNSEILIVDEVLSVGDFEFQKKCLGRMKDVSVNEGRTVLFVSHDLNAVNTLTTSAILLRKGQLSLSGATNKVIKAYYNKVAADPDIVAKDLTKPHITKVELITSNEGFIQNFSDPLNIIVYLQIPRRFDTLELSFQICSNENSEPIVYNWFTTAKDLQFLTGELGTYKITIRIPSLKLYIGEYFFRFYLSDPRGKEVFQTIERILSFQVQMNGIFNEWGWRDGVCKYIEDYSISAVKEKQLI